jgi:oligopeptide transport system permease protein
MSPAVTTRTFIIKYKDSEFIQAAKTIGVSQTRIIFTHLIPNILGRLIVRFVNMIPAVIFFEASLVFLGLKGTDEMSLGVMIQNAFDTQYLHLLLFPTIMILLITLSSQIIANNLNDSLDPKIVG